MVHADHSKEDNGEYHLSEPIFEKRTYREWTVADNASALKKLNVVQYESDLDIYYSDCIEGVHEVLADCRLELIRHITIEPKFLTTLEPIPDHKEDTPLIRQMKSAARLTGVGPMAAVAGAVAQATGAHFATCNSDIIVENGGDLYLSLSTDRHVLIYAGDSPFSNKLSLLVRASETPLGICTSSGRFGHSLSFGNADAVVAMAKDAAIADAAATAIANMVKTAEDIESAIHAARLISDLKGIVIIIGDKIGFWGAVELSSTSG